MEKNAVAKNEEEFLNLLLETEDLAEKKAGVYSRLLTEQALAEAMKELSARHAARKERLREILYGKKGEKRKGGENNEA